MTVKDFVVDQDIDIFALTETWLRPGNIDDVEIRTLCPTVYGFLRVPRGHSRGGGVGLLFKDTLQINNHITDTFKTFKLMDIHFRSLQVIRVLLLYCPPDNTSSMLFVEEFSVLLDQIIAESTGHLLISGDFNLHVDDPCDIYANHFNEILESCNLKQLVTGATHANGHSLDLVISKKDDHLITGIKMIDSVISDHYAVHCNLRVQKPHFMKKKVYYWKLCSLDAETFCEDILTSPLLRDQAVELNALVDQYNNVLRSLLDLYAPLKQRTVTLRPHAPWYKPEVGEQKNIRRRLERKWRSTRLLCNHEQYVHQCYVVNNLIESLKSSYYTDIINEHSSDQKMLFKTVAKSCKNQLTSVTPLLLTTLPWQIHLLISLPARLIEYIMGLSKGKYALGLPLWTSQFAVQSFAILPRLPRRK